VIARLLLKSSMRLIHMLNAIKLSRRSSWDLSHLLGRFWYSWVYFVMVAIFCGYFRLFELVSRKMLLCIIERSVSLLTLASTAHSLIS